MCVVLKRMKPEFVKSCFEQLGPDVRTHNNVIHKRKANGRNVFVCPWNKNGEQNGHHRPTQARIVISCCEQHARTRDLICLSHKTHAQHVVMLVGRAASSCAVFSGFFSLTCTCLVCVQTAGVHPREAAAVQKRVGRKINAGAARRPGRRLRRFWRIWRRRGEDLHEDVVFVMELETVMENRELLQSEVMHFVSKLG